MVHFKPHGTKVKKVRNQGVFKVFPIFSLCDRCCSETLNGRFYLVQKEVGERRWKYHIYLIIW